MYAQVSRPHSLRCALAPRCCVWLQISNGHITRLTTFGEFVNNTDCPNKHLPDPDCSMFDDLNESEVEGHDPAEKDEKTAFSEKLARVYICLRLYFDRFILLGLWSMQSFFLTHQ
jgi:hypothetical protein